jgi:hypothetical protein
MAHGDFTIRVESGADPAGEAIPCRFYLGARPVEVAEVIDRWLGTERSYFKVRGDDGDVYILLHEHEPVQGFYWELKLFTSGSPSPTRDC